MAAHLMIGLSRAHDIGAVGLYPVSNSPTERRLADARIPVWHLNKSPGFDYRMFGALGRVFRDFQPDVVHTHLAAQRYVFPVLLSRKTVVVHTMHNLAEYETDTFGRMLHWFAFRRNVLPVAISREVSASVKRTFGVESSATIPNCIPVEDYDHGSDVGIRWRAEVGIPPGAVVFTCVGRLEPQKNPFLLLEAFAQIQDPRAHLVLLGSGSLTGSIDEFIRSRGLSDRVHRLGKRNDIPDALAASDVFVLASNWEGNPLAVMEAMAAGLPVIATGVGGVPELVESGVEGLIVPANDVTAFHCAMQLLLDNSQRRKAMAHAARARALREFGLDRMVQGYAEFYRSELEDRRRPATRTLAAPYAGGSQ